MSATPLTRPVIAAYMYRQLGNVAAHLGYAQPGANDEGPFEEEVNQVLLECAVSLAEEIADLQAARALANLAAWRRACADLAPQYDFALDGARYGRSGVFAQAAQCLSAAEHAALPYSGHYQAHRRWLVPPMPADVG